MFNRSLSIALLSAGAIVACASNVDTSGSPSETEVEGRESVDAAIARLIGEMADIPGEPVVTRSSGAQLSDETVAQLLGASKVIHVFSDGRVRGYIVRETKAPEGVAATQVFYEAAGDAIIGRIEELPEYIRQIEARTAPGGLKVQSVGLPPGHGALFPGGTVPYEIDVSFVGSELDVLKSSIGSWNEARGPAGEALRARFVPRYPNDGRPYIRFVRTVTSSYCGQSQVGRHDNIFTNWWSHNIDIACVTEHTIHHEMGHTVGLYHEQQRCDRDQFVGVTLGGFNCDRLCGGSALDYGPFNYASVMGYPYRRSDACSINEVAPASASYRGAPWMFGASWPIDPYDVAAINQMYTGQPALPNFARGIYYLILPEHAPGKGIIIGGMNRDNGTPAIQWQSLPAWPDQHWEVIPDGAGFFEIRNRNSGKCLEISGWTMTDGANLGQWDCFGADHQKWSIAPSASSSGRFDIINKWSNKSVDIEGFSSADGARVTQWPHHGGSNQRFALDRVF